MVVRRLAYLALLALLPSASAPPDFAARVLALHNGERVRAGSTPLVWSDDLAKEAKGWGDSLAKARKFEHAPHPPGQPPQGENLFMGTRGAYAIDEMIGYWIAEKSDYRSGLFPNVSRSNYWPRVGHYTQLIWSATTQVGCAISRNKDNDYLTCRYLPAGNVIGRDPEGRLTPARPTPALQTRRPGG